MNTRGSSAVGAVITALVAGVLVAVAPSAHAAHQREGSADPFVRLVAVAPTAAGGATVSYDLRCPEGSPAFIGAGATQRAAGQVLRRQAASQIDCTGDVQQVDLELPGVPGQPLLGRAALIWTDVDHGRDAGFWYAEEIARARIDGARPPRRLQHDGVLTWSEPGAVVVEPRVRATGARRILRGVGVALTYRVRCSAGEMVSVGSQIEQGGAAVASRARRVLSPATGRGGRTVECTGSRQTVRAIVIVTPPTPFRRGPVRVETELTNGCLSEFSCSSASDARTLRLF